jgi:hypothetical protein
MNKTSIIYWIVAIRDQLGPWVLQLASESNCQKETELFSYIMMIRDNTGEIPTLIDVVNIGMFL